MSTRDGLSHWYPRSAVEIQVAYFDGAIRRPQGFDLESRRIAVDPDSWSVVLNDHRKPDTYSLTFGFRDVPLDPDLLKSLTAFIHLGTVELIDQEIPGDETDLLLVGNADEIESELGEDGQSITVKGRDQTALFLDTKWPRNLTVPLGGPIDDVIKQILALRMPAGTEETSPTGAAFPAVENFPVIWDGLGEAVGKAFVSRREVSSGDLTKPPVSTARKRKRRDIDGAFTEANLWDVIYRIAQHAGVILEVRTVEGEASLVLRPPETLAPESTGEANEFQFLYGKDLEYLRVRREFGALTVPNVAVRCVIDGRLEVGLWPEEPVITDFTSDGKPKKPQFHAVNVSGFKSAENLRDLAKVLYFQMGRKETTFQFATKDLESFNSRDLTKIRSGATVRLEIDPEDRRYFGNISRAQREARLTALGYAEQVAGELARVWDLVIERPRVYFLDEARMSWSNDEGFRMEGSAVNFLGAATTA